MVDEIKHQDSKTSGELLYASEWNKDHNIDKDKLRKLLDLATIAEVIEEIAWANLDAEQGVCTDGTYLFVTTTERLSRWTKTGTRTHDIDAFNGDVDVDHAGDCAYYNNKVYVTCTNYPTCTIRRIYVYNANDLSFVNKYNITTNPASGIEIGGLAWDPLSERFWLCSYEETPDKIYKYTTAFVYDDRTLTLPQTNCQGITFASNGVLLISGCYNLVECCPVKNMKDGENVMILRAHDIIGHEGIDLDPDGETLWLCKWHTGGDDPLLKMKYLPL